MNAIEIEKLSKVYRLYRKPSDRLRDALRLTKRKVYTELRALDDVSLSVRKGETVGIIGTNGSGKSTLLKIITGVVTPTEGAVRAEGRISALLELGAGFNMEYTGVENVYLNGTMMGFSKEEIDRRLPEILSFADIGEYVDQPVRTYSSGMFVRLAFAVAINIDPEILIVDEALSVGDAFFQAKCYHKFEEFRKQGKTILFVSHDLGSISKYCDRVIILNKGKVHAEGSPKEMVDLYKTILADHDGILENADALDYGEGQAAITEYGFYDREGRRTDTLRKDEPFEIRMKVRFDRPVRDPIFAFSLKDVKGTEITGTNTMYEGTPVPAMEAGDTAVIVFRQDMALQGGDYLLSLGCTGFAEGSFHVFHRLYDVLGVTVISEKNTVGFFDMRSTVTVEREAR